ncbi:LysE family translocator [Methylobacterium sp. sgz302541]|uniref:LysE family translocator n=1 Tax=unclassified Methylobacterium TaxID=2615210 RepID=UPI003D33186F
MPLSGLALFVAVYTVAAASPGPGIAALVARVLARGTGGIAFFVAGFVVGDLIWFGLTAAGFALAMQAVAPVFVALRYGGALYLAYLAWRTWTAPPDDRAPETVNGDGRLRLFLGGFALTLGNPKVILFFLALLPSVIDLDHATPLGIAEIGATIVVVLTTILFAYVLAAARAHRAFTSRRARRAINRGAGIVMAGAAAVIATR